MQSLQPLAYSVEQAAELLGVCRKHAYECIAEGTIPSVRIGRRILIPRMALEKLLAEPSTKKTAD
jgi:excisionase family DNA binding protein